MAGCYINAAAMTASVGKLKGYAQTYRDEANTFVLEFKTAIAAMEGETKEALLEFFTTKIEGYITKDIPDVVDGLASLLEANADSFSEVDAQIAASIKNLF